MKCSVLVVAVMCWVMVTCEETQREDETEGNHLSEHQVENFQKSLFNIFERLGNSLNMNQTMTDEKTGNIYNNLNIIKSLTLNIYLSTNNTEKNFEEKNTESPANSAANTSELLERIAKVEMLGETLTKNYQTIKEQNREIMSNFSSLVANNTRQIIHNQTAEIKTSCKESSTSGVYQMQSINRKVYCEMDSFTGGWLVIQQRDEHSLNFNKSWAEYRAGFGTIGKTNDFWLGLEPVHQITKDGSCELIVEMKNSSRVYEYARYSSFIVAGEDEKYKLTVGGHSGTAEDQLSKKNNTPFATIDNDTSSRRCAQTYGGGWWFDGCFYCHLTFHRGGRWINNLDEKYALTYSRMMIRC